MPGNIQVKENEISALKPLLTSESVPGRILTLDARCTPNGTCVPRFASCKGITSCSPRTINQPCEQIWSIYWKTPGQTDDEGLRPKRGTKRMGGWSIAIFSVVLIWHDWFAQQWAGIEQVFRLECTVRLLHTNQLRREVVYGLSSLPMRQAPPARLLSLIRGHWAIENRLHYRRDVSLGEDACQTRTGPVPGLLAQLNSTVLGLLDRLGVRYVARQMRYFDAHVEQALALVLMGHCSVF